MKDKIKELIETIPKVYVKFIKNRPELLEWVMANTLLPTDRTLPEHVRSALNGETDICKNGSKMKWVGANTGWGSCGRPTSCQCAREAVSASVSAAKANRSQSDIDAENQKREATNLTKYGVTNTGQTTKAKKAHSEFYGDSSNIASAVATLEATMMSKYGVKNAQQVEEIKKKTVNTMVERYGVENATQSPEIQERIKQTNMEKYGVERPSQNLAIQEKSKQTNIERYGVEHAMKLPEYKERAKETTIQRYGGVGMGSNATRSKITGTMNERHGGFGGASQSILQKASETSVVKYGVEWSTQRDMPKDSLIILKDKVQLEELLKSNAIYRVAEILGVSDGTVSSYADALGIDIPKVPTQAENDIDSFLRANNIAFDRNTRSVISPKELDFYIPEFNLAIEFNGLYWHSDKFKGKYYHSEKTKSCNSKNIQLLHIFEDEWATSSNVIKKKILHLCGKTTKSVVGARKLKISLSTKEEVSAFIDQNHVQGMPPGATHYLKVTHQDHLVSVILLKKTPIKGVIDMTRFCTDQQGTYPGLMSKVVSFIKNTFEYTELITFADLRYSNGDVYKKSGFTEVTRLAPDYFYIVRDKREHKFNLRKNKMSKKFGVDVGNKSESELAQEVGLRKIYDCGKIKYKMNLK